MLIIKLMWGHLSSEDSILHEDFIQTKTWVDAIGLSVICNSNISWPFSPSFLMGVGKVVFQRDIRCYYYSKTLYTDILYSSKLLYNVGNICSNIPV